MKRRILAAAVMFYAVMIVLFYCMGGILRDAVSHSVTVTNVFWIESELNNRFYMYDSCIYQNPENGEHFVYILDQGDQYDDDGYYIIPYHVEVRGVDGAIAAIGGLHDEIVVFSPVTEDMVGHRAVIGEWIEYTGGDGT